MLKNLPNDVIGFKTLKYLPVETIMFLCRTNSEYSEFCNDNKLCFISVSAMNSQRASA